MSELNSYLKENMEYNIEEFNVGMNTFFICRKDGVLLYNSNKESMDNHSIGALIGGVWQAALTLAKFGENNSKDSDFRLNFSTSSDGFYILPLFQNNVELYLGIIYKSQKNPAQLWHYCRKIRDLVLENLPAEVISSSDNSTTLFSDITDNEMDKLFSFSGGL